MSGSIPGRTVSQGRPGTSRGSPSISISRARGSRSPWSSTVRSCPACRSRRIRNSSGSSDAAASGPPRASLRRISRGLAATARSRTHSGTAPFSSSARRGRGRRTRGPLTRPASTPRSSGTRGTPPSTSSVTSISIRSPSQIGTSFSTVTPRRTPRGSRFFRKAPCRSVERN